MPSPIPAASYDAAVDAETPPHPSGASAFDATEFDGLTKMIGGDGAMEMIMIFEAETRDRLRRVAAGGQDTGTLVREMHTLKGAAGTVAAPHLSALSRSLEQAAHQGIAPTQDDVESVAAALEDWLAAVHNWCTSQASVA